MTEPHWFVAFVHSCQERKLAERLEQQGVRCYVPVQKVKRKWSDRIKIVDKLLLPGVVFVRCDETARKTLFRKAYGICTFLMDRGSGDGKVAVVPQRQMNDFIRAVDSLNGEGEIEFVNCRIEPGDMVRVKRGPLEGMICECVEVQHNHKLVIRLGLLGSALVSIDAGDVAKGDVI